MRKSEKKEGVSDPLITRIYKVRPAEKELLMAMTDKQHETKREMWKRAGIILDQLEIEPAEKRKNKNFRMDVPVSIFKKLNAVSDRTGQPVIQIVLRIAEHMAMERGQ